VTDGSLLDGVKFRKNGVMTTDSVVMRASRAPCAGSRANTAGALSVQQTPG
jgi:fructose-1,6-bisphosphatase/sedoheptulose 1,7-bisphosphatase-like protein